MNQLPPSFILSFLKWFCRQDLHPSIEGDLIEMYQHRAAEKSIRSANRKVFWEVIRLLRPGMLKGLHSGSIENSAGLLKNYFVVAKRNIWRQKSFSMIQIAGLTFSICVAVIVAHIVTFETSFDNFHRDIDRIYRVTSNTTYGDNVYKFSGVPRPMPEAVADDFASIKNIVPIFMESGTVLIPTENNEAPDEYTIGNDVVSTSPDYFEVFDYEWLAGSQRTALSEPNTVVLTENRARKYFGQQDLNLVIGRLIMYSNDTVQVSGVVANPKINSDLTFQEFRSRVGRTKPIAEVSQGDWGVIGTNNQLLVKLVNGATTDQVAIEFEQLEQKYCDEEASSRRSHGIQPFADIHWNAELGPFNKPASSKTTMYGLLILAGFLILMGALNYISLSTAQNETRWKEIGVRKTLGGSRNQLLIQFMIETIFLALIAGLLAFLIAPFVINMFTDYLPAVLTEQSIIALKPFGFMVAISLSVGVLAGAYPAFTITRFNPLRLLRKGNVNRRSTESFTRHSIATVKFVIAQFFIVAVIIVDQQISYSTNIELGFAKEGIITTRIPWTAPASEGEVLLEKLKEIPAIEKVCLTGPSPLLKMATTAIELPTESGEEVFIAEMKVVDSAYVNFYGLKLIAGSNLEAKPSSSRQVLINKSFVNKLGFETPEQAVGFKYRDWLVVGVVNDFHTSSTHGLIDPLVMGDLQDPVVAPVNFYHIKLAKSNNQHLKETIHTIESRWEEVFPNFNFSYQFIDDEVASFYKKEQQLAHLLRWSVGMTLFISCLGLLGLTLFQVNKRIKEVGIRKVLGASVNNILMLFSLEAVKPVVLAIFISAPIALYAANKWLDNFAYTVEVKLWMFALPGVFMLIIALSTILLQVRKTALTNPANSLRDE